MNGYSENSRIFINYRVGADHDASIVKSSLGHELARHALSVPEKKFVSIREIRG